MRCPYGMYQHASFSTSCMHCPDYFVSVESRSHCVDSFVVSDFFSVLLLLFGGLLVFLYSASILFVLIHRLSKPIYNASTNFLVLILLGYILMSTSAVLFGTTQSVTSYQIRLWFLCFGFNFSFLSLFSKLYRLNAYIYFYFLFLSKLIEFLTLNT